MHQFSVIELIGDVHGACTIIVIVAAILEVVLVTVILGKVFGGWSVRNSSEKTSSKLNAILDSKRFLI